MTYVAWSVIAGEQPTTAKWNELGTNDAGFNNGTYIANLEVGSVTAVKNDYKFSYYRTAATSPTGLVTFDTQEFDTGSNYSTGTGKFTAPVAGFYQINSQLRFAITASIQNLEIILYKNGSAFKDGSMFINMYSGSSGVAACNLATLVALAANDYLQIFVINSPTLALTGLTQTDNYFQGFLVSNT